MNQADYEAQISAEVLAECESFDLIRNRFTYTIFVSRSKGRGRSRSRLSEIELISDEQETARRFYSWNKFPFDTKATEVYEGVNIDGLDAERLLMAEIPKRAKRGSKNGNDA